MVTDILQLHGCRCAALLGAGGKSTLRAILEKEAARLGEERVFYEIGASNGKCLLLYEKEALRLRPETDCAIVVAGLGALDWPIREVCENFALHRGFAAGPEHLCDEHDVLFVVRETLRAAALPAKQLRVLLNQADTGSLHIRASGMLRALQDEKYTAAALSLLA